MAGTRRRYVRPASMQASTRAGDSEERPMASVASTRRGATSPSAVSSSDGEDGGAPLHIGMGSLNLDKSPTAYAPPHIRQGLGATNYVRNNRDTSAVDDSPAFQVGNVPDDADVFGSPTRSAGSPLKFPNSQSRVISRLNSADRAANEVHRLDLSRQQNEDFGYTQNFRGRPPCLDDDLTVVRPDQRVTSLALGTSEFDSQVRTLRPKPSDLGARHQVGGVDAQSFYPPTACVFVANLPEGVRDNSLEAEVTRQFSVFGTVFVKIRRDSRNMPFAFCQFTKTEDAQVAMVEGKGLMIHGRACRTEAVRANRTYVMYNRDGSGLSPEDARHALAGLGPLTKCEQLDAQIQADLGLSEAVLVELQKFDPSKDLVAAFRHDQIYCVVAYDPKKLSRRSKADDDEAWLRRYEVERRSIFIGNLPIGDDELESKIREVAGEIGDVVNVQVIYKEGRNSHETVFSFVEFARPDMAEIAVERLGGRHLFGSRVRVERRASRDTGSRSARRIRSQRFLTDSQRSPTQGREQNPQPHDNCVFPLTPLRLQTAGNNSTSAGSPETSASASMASPFPWMGGYASPNYTTSPYNVQTGAGSFPAPPSATSQGMPTPYAYYPANAYSWAAPYLSDPNLAPMAFMHAYGQVPMPAIHASENTPETPTRVGGAGTSEVSGSQGGNTV